MVEFKAVSSERDFMEFKVSDVSKFADLLDLAKKTTANLKDVESQTILFESTPECMYATVSSRDIWRTTLTQSSQRGSYAYSMMALNYSLIQKKLLGHSMSMLGSCQ